MSRSDSKASAASAGATTTSHRTFVSYIDRTRDFYASQGYERPYAWAHHHDAPFTPLTKPLSRCRVAVVTTASPWHDQKTSPGTLRGEKHVETTPSWPAPERLYTDDLAWDKQTTHTNDVASFVPVAQLRCCVEEGRLASLAAQTIHVPTDYSARRTRDVDAPDVLRLCREDGVDIAILTPL
jgi:hypothetical protein